MPSPKGAAAIKRPIKQRPATPVWRGPEVDGITFSLLSRFLVCRERFRIMVVEGLRPKPSFSAPLEFGNMWHVCEEWHAEGVKNWESFLEGYARKLLTSYPMDQEQVNHWYEICKTMFPIYADHWAKHPDVVNRTPLLQEQVFDVPYKLPSGRVVRLRGKWDSVDLVKDGKAEGVYLQENKSKSTIDSKKLTRQLSFDLQTMIYLIALSDGIKDFATNGAHPILGVRYNVVRRSAHKSTDSMLKKIGEDTGSGRINEWFARWNVKVLPGECRIFKDTCLDPILEQVCDWWEFITKGTASHLPLAPCHWRHPFGVYNVLDEGGSSELDEYLATGSTAGLVRITNLFPELEER